MPGMLFTWVGRWQNGLEMGFNFGLRLSVPIPRNSRAPLDAVRLPPLETADELRWDAQKADGLLYYIKSWGKNVWRMMKKGLIAS